MNSAAAELLTEGGNRRREREREREGEREREPKGGEDEEQTTREKSNREGGHYK